MNLEKITISSASVVCAQGGTTESFYENCLGGKSPQRKQKAVSFLGRLYSYDHFELTPFADEWIPASMRRRMSLLARMTAVAAHETLQASGLMESLDKDNLGIVFATGWGEVDSIYQLLMQATEEQDVALSPAIFHSSVHNAPAGYLGILLGCHGPTLTLSQGSHSFESALSCALSLLHSGRAPLVLVGACDTFFDFVVFEKKMDTPMPISAGSAFYLLEKESDVQARQGKILSHLLCLGEQQMRGTSDICDYAFSLRDALQEVQKLSSIDLVALVGPQERQEQTQILRHIYPEKSPPVFAFSYPCGRPTQSAEYFLSCLGILQKQKMPQGDIFFLHEGQPKAAQAVAFPCQTILWMSLTDEGYHRSFLLEKPGNSRVT